MNFDRPGSYQAMVIPKERYHLIPPAPREWLDLNRPGWETEGSLTIEPLMSAVGFETYKEFKPDTIKDVLNLPDHYFVEVDGCSQDANRGYGYYRSPRAVIGVHHWPWNSPDPIWGTPHLRPLQKNCTVQYVPCPKPLRMWSLDHLDLI